jgi:flagellar hook-length control protein FliK
MSANGVAQLVLSSPVAAAVLPSGQVAQADSRDAGGAGQPFTAALAAELILQTLAGQAAALLELSAQPTDAVAPAEASGATAQIVQIATAPLAAAPTDPGKATPAAASTIGLPLAAVVPPLAQAAIEALPTTAQQPTPQNGVATATEESAPALSQAVAVQPTTNLPTVGGLPLPSLQPLLDTGQAAIDAPQGLVDQPVPEASGMRLAVPALPSHTQPVMDVNAGVLASAPARSAVQPLSQAAVQTAAQMVPESVAQPVSQRVAPQAPALPEAAAAQATAQAESSSSAPSIIAVPSWAQAPSAVAARPQAMAATQSGGRSVRAVKGIAVYQAAPQQAPQNIQAKPASSVPRIQAPEPVVAANPQTAQPASNNSGQAVSHSNDLPLTAAPQTIASQAPPSAPTQSFDRPGVVEQVADAQVWARVQNNGGSVTIRLEPPELGRVRLQVRQEAGGIRGLLEVESPRALAQLQSEAPAMAARLADGGVHLRRMDVVLLEPSPSNQMPGSSLADQQHPQGNFQASQQGRQEQPDAPPGPTGEPDADVQDATPVMAVSADGSVNVWI